MSNSKDASNDTDLQESFNALLDLKNYFTEFSKKILNEWSQDDIEKYLNARIIGQPELTAAVADFIHYHLLRLVYTELKPRPILIAGPSGCGKTEIFRCISDFFTERSIAYDTYRSVQLPVVEIINGAMITMNGWSGDYKLQSSITAGLACGGILVIDEFDKLALPSYTSHGDNVSHHIQNELLKMLEGEFKLPTKQHNYSIDTSAMSVALIGAFEPIRNKYTKSKTEPIGFNTPAFATFSEKINQPLNFTISDFIQYGVTPEIMSRIAIISTIRELSPDAYRKIALERIRCTSSELCFICNDIDSTANIQLNTSISDEKIDNLITQALREHTGARWIGLQLDQILLNNLRNVHMAFTEFYDPVFKTDDSDDSDDLEDTEDSLYEPLTINEIEPIINSESEFHNSDYESDTDFE